VSWGDGGSSTCSHAGANQGAQADTYRPAQESDYSAGARASGGAAARAVGLTGAAPRQSNGGTDKDRYRTHECSLETAVSLQNETESVSHGYVNIASCAAGFAGHS
jgi:hypothetical protein